MYLGTGEKGEGALSGSTLADTGAATLWDAIANHVSDLRMEIADTEARNARGDLRDREGGAGQSADDPAR